jgi:hypothetical protein
MMWAIFVLSVAEIAVVHLMLGFWYPRTAMILTAISVVFVIWLGWAIASFKSLPVELGETQLIMRAGRIKSITMAVDAIAEVIADPPRDRIDSVSTLDLALIAHANILVVLKAPTPRTGLLARTPILAIAHRLDEPAGFVTALRSRIA